MLLVAGVDVKKVRLVLFRNERGSLICYKSTFQEENFESCHKNGMCGWLSCGKQTNILEWKNMKEMNDVWKMKHGK